MKIEIIEWEDSSFGNPAWTAVKDWCDHINTMLCYSSGFVVKEDKDSIVICAHIAPHSSEPVEAENYDIQGGMRIPLSAIRKRVVLRDDNNKKNNATRYERRDDEGSGSAEHRKGRKGN